MKLARQVSGEGASDRCDTSPLHLKPHELVGDVTNAVLEYCAQGIDAMEGCAAASLCLEQGELDNLLQGTAQLHQALHSKLSQHLQTFEQYAKETCLHIPAGLMAAEVSLPQMSCQCDDQAERQLDMQLISIRKQIVMTQRSQRQAKQEIARLHQELMTCGSAAQLADVAAASGPDKENLAEGASAIVTAALQLQPLLARTQKLRDKDPTNAPRFADSASVGCLAEAEITKHEAAVHSLPTNRLKDLTETLHSMLRAE